MGNTGLLFPADGHPVAVGFCTGTVKCMVVTDCAMIFITDWITVHGRLTGPRVSTTDMWTVDGPTATGAYTATGRGVTSTVII